MWGEGVNVLWYNILTPPPSKNIQEQYFVNGIQWQLSFKTQSIYISQTILFWGWHFFLMGLSGWGWGWGSIYYGIIYWPPPKNIHEQYLYMESSDNLASTHKTITYHRQYLSMVDISFLWDGGVNILWYNILTPLPPQWYKGMTTSKQNPMTALLYHFDHLQVFVDTISILIVQIKFEWVGGQNIMV